MTTLIDKRVAQAQGLTFYFTGQPCRSGHIAPRYVKNDRCEVCKKAKDRRDYVRHAEERRRKSREWYEQNLDAGRAARNAYHARKKGDPQYQKVRKAYQTDNREDLIAKQRDRNATPEARAAKAAKRKEQAHLYRGYEQKRRARLKGAIPKWYGELDDFVLEQAAELCVRRQAATGVNWEVDHMIPLLATRATGLHWHANIQVIPQRLNRSKNRRMIFTQPGEWVRHAFRLCNVTQSGYVHCDAQ